MVRGLTVSRRLTVSDEDAARLIEGWLPLPWSVRRNCWTLTAIASRALYGRDVPLKPFAGPLPERGARHLLFAQHPERRRWREVATPEDGAVVLMSRGALGDEHAGLFIGLGRGAVLHVDRPHGTVFEPPIAVTALRGWRMTFHVPVPDS